MRPIDLRPPRDLERAHRNFLLKGTLGTRSEAFMFHYETLPDEYLFEHDAKRQFEEKVQQDDPLVYIRVAFIYYLPALQPYWEWYQHDRRWSFPYSNRM